MSTTIQLQEVVRAFAVPIRVEGERIIEDKKGILWFGGDGLSRYDGKSFTCFTTKDGLINNAVWSILEDGAGNLWVGTRETGLYLYDGKTFTSFSE